VVFPSDKKTSLHGQIMHLWARAELSPYVGLEAENVFTVLAMVAAGFGNPILPGFLRGIQMPNVVWTPIDIDDQWTVSSIVLIYREEEGGVSIQSRFIDYIHRYSERN